MPVLSIAGPAALVFVIMRCFPHVTRAVVVLAAGLGAIVTRDPKRRAACLKVLGTLSHQDGDPPGEQPGTLPAGVRQAPRRAVPARRGQPDLSQVGRAHRGRQRDRARGVPGQPGSDHP
jgi:hypothetical protein